MRAMGGVSVFLFFMDGQDEQDNLIGWGHGRHGSSSGPQEQGLRQFRLVDGFRAGRLPHRGLGGNMATVRALAHDRR